MSIAIHSSKHAGHVPEASAVSRRRDSEPDAASTPERSAETKAPKGRHALMNALSEALASLGSAAIPGTSEAAATDDAAAPVATTREQKEALHAFSHELFNALRPTSDGPGNGHHGRGFAWGRTSPGDLAERLEALAQKLGGATPTPTPDPVDAATDPVTTGSTSTVTTGTPTPGTTTAGTTATGTAAANTAAARTVAASTTAASAAVTTSPAVVPSTTSSPATPVTTPVKTTAPVDSPLLAAFRQLTSALKGSATSGATDTSPADALAALLHKMSQALMSDGHVEAPASGSLIDVTA